MAHPTKPESVGPILDRLLKNLEIDKKVDEGQALLIWAEAVGPKMAARTRAESVYRGRMTVLAQNPAWVQEGTFMRIQIKDKLIPFGWVWEEICRCYVCNLSPCYYQ